MSKYSHFLDLTLRTLTTNDEIIDCPQGFSDHRQYTESVQRPKRKSSDPLCSPQPLECTARITTKQLSYALVDVPFLGRVL